MATFLNNISFRPDDIRDLRDLIITTLWTDEDFRKYVNLKPAMNGENIGFVGDLGDIGTKTSIDSVENAEIIISRFEYSPALASVKMPEVYHGNKGSVYSAKLKDLIQGAKLIFLAHGFKTDFHAVGIYCGERMS